MSWIAVTEEIVKSRMSGAELTAFKTAALSSGQSAETVIAELISQIVDRIRGECAANARNTLGPALTIPPRLLSAAVDLIRYRMATRLPGMKGLIDELRQKEYDSAEKLLERVARGEFAVEDPTATATDGAHAPTPAFATKPLRFGRESQEGL